MPQERTMLATHRVDLVRQVGVQIGRQQLVHVSSPEAPEVLTRRRLIAEYFVDGAGAGHEAISVLELVCALPPELSARHAAVFGEVNVVRNAEVLARLRPAACLGPQALARGKALGGQEESGELWRLDVDEEESHNAHTRNGQRHTE